MVTIETIQGFEPVRGFIPSGAQSTATGQPVLIVRDDGADNYLLDSICEFLGIGVQHVASDDDIGPILRTMRPVAVIADLAGEVQDGYHIMKTAAAYNRHLPVLLLTDGDPALLGAIDAVQEIWGLTRVAIMTGKGDIAEFVDFLCQSTRDAGVGRLMRI